MPISNWDVANARLLATRGIPGRMARVRLRNVPPCRGEVPDTARRPVDCAIRQITGLAGQCAVYSRLTPAVPAGKRGRRMSRINVFCPSLSPVTNSTPRCWSMQMLAQLDIWQSAGKTSPGQSASDNRRSRLTSPCSLPACWQKPRSMTALLAKEIGAPRRAIGNANAANAGSPNYAVWTSAKSLPPKCRQLRRLLAHEPQRRSKQGASQRVPDVDRAALASST